ncbi:MAG: hypothetical protein L3J51_09170 [Cocleimonas sp.]|nr:hypothetical protein [Cocleimonas sp.]
MKTLSAFSLFILISLSACSSNKTANTSNITNMQKIEMGKIISVKTVAVKPEDINSYGNVGVSVGSGGHSGVYGSVDLATIGKLYRNATKPSTAQQFIITKANGETVAITQPSSKEVFKIGDSVKILLEDGKAKVIH